MTEAHINYCHMGPWPVYVGFTNSPKAFQRELKRIKVREKVAFHTSNRANATVHIFDGAGTTTFIVTMDKAKKTSVEQIASLIAHEAVHIVQEMWSVLGERTPGHEAEAYLVQHITQFCLQLALKTGRTRKFVP